MNQEGVLGGGKYDQITWSEILKELIKSLEQKYVKKTHGKTFKVNATCIFLPLEKHASVWFAVVPGVLLATDILSWKYISLTQAHKAQVRV